MLYARQQNSHSEQWQNKTKRHASTCTRETVKVPEDRAKSSQPLNMKQYQVHEIAVTNDVIVQMKSIFNSTRHHGWMDGTCNTSSTVVLILKLNLLI